MLEVKESQLNRIRSQSSHKDTPSALTVLYAKGNNTNRNNNNGTQPCRNFQRGHFQFGERCRFIHGNMSQKRTGEISTTTVGNNFVKIDQRLSRAFFIALAHYYPYGSIASPYQGPYPPGPPRFPPHYLAHPTVAQVRYTKPARSHAPPAQYSPQHASAHYEGFCI